MFYIFPNIVIIFHLCLRFSRNPLCAVQDARAGDFVVAVFLADRVEGGIEFTAFLLLFGIFEEGELFGWFLKNDKRFILFLQQDSRGHLTFMAVNREIPTYSALPLCTA